MAAIGDKSAVAKVKKIKDKKHTQYLKNKALAKRKEWNKNSRRAKVWKFIESEINLKSKPIDEPWVKQNNQKMTPLIAVIKQGNLKAVQALIRMKVSPSVSWKDKGDQVLPLEEAAWLGQEEITLLLMENGACKTKKWDFGVLHGAIARKMFAVLRVAIKKGARIDCIYAGCTPLCAALTCGKKGTGDVRMVRLLLSAKADLNKRTGGPRYANRSGTLTHLDVAKKYSNVKCLRLISEKYKK